MEGKIPLKSYHQIQVVGCKQSFVVDRENRRFVPLKVQVKNTFFKAMSAPSFKKKKDDFGLCVSTALLNFYYPRAEVESFTREEVISLSKTLYPGMPLVNGMIGLSKQTEPEFLQALAKHKLVYIRLSPDVDVDTLPDEYDILVAPVGDTDHAFINPNSLCIVHEEQKP